MDSRASATSEVGRVLPRRIGRIEARSAGPGSEFVARLPRRDSPSKPATAQTSANERPGVGRCLKWRASSVEPAYRQIPRSVAFFSIARRGERPYKRDKHRPSGRCNQQSLDWICLRIGDHGVGHL